MSVARVRVKYFLQPSNIRKWSTNSNVDYSEKPQYPPILDPSREAKLRRKKTKYHDQIKAIKTVEEKLIALNIPKYYGWKCVMLREGETLPYNCLPFSQYVTRTHFIHQSLAELWSTSQAPECPPAIVERIKNQVKDAVIMEHLHLGQELNNVEDKPVAEQDDALGKAILRHINRIILCNLSDDFPHLQHLQIDHEPRVESFWFVGGINPPENVRKSKEGLSWLKEYANEPVDRAIQYIGHPFLQLRTNLPLSPVTSREDCKSSEFPIPVYQYDPRTLGDIFSEHRHGTNIPGFWPGDPCEFGILSFHLRGHLEKRPKLYGDVDAAEALHAQAILAAYGWLLAQASYQGFSTFQDLTHPLTTQSVISNGQYWSFYVYQLNTTLLHSEHCVENPLCNLCWGTDSLKLFDKVEGKTVIGFNDEVLKKLLSFYTNVPNIQEVGIKPYLGDTEKYIADIEDDKRRAWLEKCFKHMYSNRPRHRLSYEVYHWEKIYKIDHKTRPLEPRRRPFELGINPYKRRYDEHVPPYIPKGLRTHKRDKWEKTYYPKIED